MHNDGRAYEQFVALLQQALLNAENITNQKNIKIQLNKKIIDSCGIEREFDLYWEYELGGITYKTIIECKDYNSKIQLDKIDALIGKTRDLPDIRAVFATKKGYKSGAKQKAKHNKIDLLIVREQNDSDWQNVDGAPYIKKLVINTSALVPTVITNFTPMIDANWVKENTNIDFNALPSLSALNNEIFIEEISGEKYSLLDLSSSLEPLDNSKFGNFLKEEYLEDAFISGPDFRYKIKGYRIKYTIFKPHTNEMVIDFSKELIGVIEYLQKGTKKSIFKKGIR